MAKGIEIHIHLGNYQAPKMDQKADYDEERASALDMRLMSRDKLSDSELDKLNADVLSFAGDMVGQKKYSQLHKFLQKATHHLTEELREALSDMLGGIE